MKRRGSKGKNLKKTAEKREDWFTFQRSFPFNEIPANARLKAWKARPKEAKNQNGFEAAQWQPIGPTSTNSYFQNNWGVTSGRINTIAVSPTNPNLILVGAATGGIWRSTDGGTNFAPVSDSQVDLSVGSIAFAPGNSSIVYAGMGDTDGGYLGSGVLKSVDAGQTWTRVSNATLPSPGRIVRVVVDPNNPNRVYAAQYATRTGNSVFSSGLWISNDGGVSWARTIIGLTRDLIVHPTDPNTLYLAMSRVDSTSGTTFGTTGGVFKSIDAGQSWTRIYTAPYASTTNIKIAQAPSLAQNLCVLVGSGSVAQVEASIDGGATWINRGGATFDAQQFNYNCYLFVHPTLPNTIYLGTRDLWRSVDGGTTFANVTGNFTVTGSYSPNASRAHPDQHHFYIPPTNPSLIYIANDGGIYRSTDAGATFQSLNASLNLTMFVGLSTHPTDATRTYGGTQDNGTQKRTGASSWREFRTGDGGQTVIDGLDPSIIYTTYVYNTVYRNNGNGDSFGGTIGSDTTFNTDRSAFYPPFVGNGVDSTLYFGTYRLYTSANRGANWTAAGGTQDLTNGGTDVLSAIGVGRSNLKTIYTGTAQGKVMVSTDGGTTWTIAVTGLPVRFIKSIVVSQTDSNTAYLTVSGYDSGHVFKTTNAGASWTNISANLPNVPTNTLLADPRAANTLYVGTDIGIFRSTTGGNSWESFNGGLPPTIITALTAQPNGLMQAATFGRGAFEMNTAATTKRTQFDYDGDGSADLSVYRPTNGTWYLLNSNTGYTGYQFGVASDKIVPADYDGDGKTDVAVYRNGDWFVLRSRDGFTSYNFGTASDIPTPADFDGDGRAELAVYRPSEGVWFQLNTLTNNVSASQFGTSEDKPVAADYDADGKTDLAVYRPSVGTWYILRSRDGYTGYQFGTSEDKPVAADYDGDGKADVAVFRASDATWYILKSGSGFASLQFGVSTDVPAPADFDGDGKTDIAVFRPEAGDWYQFRSTTNAFTAFQFGQNGDQPTTNAFVR